MLPMEPEGKPAKRADVTMWALTPGGKQANFVWIGASAAAGAAAVHEGKPIALIKSLIDATVVMSFSHCYVEKSARIDQFVDSFASSDQIFFRCA